MDENFVVASWLNSYYTQNPREFFVRRMQKYLYNRMYVPIIKHIMAKSSVKIACAADDDNTAIGFSVFDNETLQYVYVKEVFRRFGVAKLLVPEGLQYYSHETNSSREIRRRKPEYKNKLQYNPFAL